MGFLFTNFQETYAFNEILHQLRTKNEWKTFDMIRAPGKYISLLYCGVCRIDFYVYWEIKVRFFYALYKVRQEQTFIYTNRFLQRTFNDLI